MQISLKIFILALWIIIFKQVINPLFDRRRILKYLGKREEELISMRRIWFAGGGGKNVPCWRVYQVQFQKWSGKLVNARFMVMDSDEVWINDDHVVGSVPPGKKHSRIHQSVEAERAKVDKFIAELGRN